MPKPYIITQPDNETDTPTNSGVSTETIVSASSSGKRRTFTAAYKLSILEQVNACTTAGDIGALHRREGLSSSILSKWRHGFLTNGSHAFSTVRGRKIKHDATTLESTQLKKRVTYLEHQLNLAKSIIELQKKASQILNIALPSIEEHV